MTINGTLDQDYTKEEVLEEMNDGVESLLHCDTWADWLSFEDEAVAAKLSSHEERVVNFTVHAQVYSFEEDDDGSSDKHEPNDEDLKNLEDEFSDVICSGTLGEINFEDASVTVEKV